MGIEPKPFLKWAGGKQRLITQYKAYFPVKFSRYFEVFLGGGAVFFHLRNEGRLKSGCYLFDNNRELVNAYTAVRDGVEPLIRLLEQHRENHSASYYYGIRGRDRGDAPLTPLEAAARTLYLNKTCYNGLFRVNSRGEFNVPMGSYAKPRILDAENLRAASRALEGSAIETRHFREVPALAEKGDFIYFDPPYAPSSKTAGFTSYTPGAFTEADQHELRDMFRTLTEKGCLCMLSNSHTPLVMRLYGDFRVEIISAGRAINSKAEARGPVTEVLVLNY